MQKPSESQVSTGATLAVLLGCKRRGETSGGRAVGRQLIAAKNRKATVKPYALFQKLFAFYQERTSGTSFFSLLYSDGTDDFLAHSFR